MLAMLGAEITGICAQNQGNAISEDPKFKNFPGEHAPDPPVKSATGARLSIGKAIYTRNPSMQKAGYAPGSDIRDII